MRETKEKKSIFMKCFKSTCQNCGRYVDKKNNYTKLIKTQENLGT